MLLAAIKLPVYIAILALLLLILGFAVWYLARRTAFIFNTRAGWWYAVFGIALLSGFYFMMAASEAWSVRPLAHFCSLAGGVMVGFLFFLTLFMLAVDMVHCFVRMPRWLFGGLVALLSVGMTVFSMYKAFSPQVVEVRIRLPKLQHPLRAVQLTDLHIGHYRGEKHVQQIVNQVNSLHPDIVFFTGDCFESWYNLDGRAIAPLEQLQVPLFFVAGNHEGYVDSDRAKQLLREAGVRVLENEVVESKGLCIVWLDYMSADAQHVGMHAPKRPETIENTLPKLPIDTSLPVIVLHHSPIGADYMENAGASLLLSGHTHGGQIFPLTLLNNLLFQFNRGLNTQNRLQVYTSCGTGTFGPPMRFGTVSEITLIDFIPYK